MMDQQRCILTIDGGGVRGLSSLLILKEIMEDIGQRTNVDELPRPSEYFNLIGGTSTGGLIALMLGTVVSKTAGHSGDSITRSGGCLWSLACEAGATYSESNRLF
jgi:patatin-like phospholipase/acyl hydrolase